MLCVPFVNHFKEQDLDILCTQTQIPFKQTLDFQDHKLGDVKLGENKLPTPVDVS